VKEQQRRIWGSGDYHAVGVALQPVAERLCHAADLQAGWRVLDVACGSGNVALAAARCGCEVTGLDLVPALLERAERRAAAEGFALQLVEGDAEALPFPDGSFDAVVSAFGVMFAPDQALAADELLRVCRPGGRIGLAAWREDGFVGELFATLGRPLRRDPNAPSPLRWGAEREVRRLLAGGTAEIAVRSRAITMRAPSPFAYVEHFRRSFGPALAAFEAAGPDGEQELERELVELVETYGRRTGEAVAIDASYLEVVATRA
jgi:SAM-dependent methyltransferase